jgi:penicillin amidase
MTTTFIILFSILAFFGLLFAAIFLYLYWWTIQRAQPKLNGEISLACLEQPVEVLRDKHGVPHIYAKSRADLFRAQGFVHAQDRMWQMEQNRRIARGTLAEIFGEAALEADRFSRIVGFWRAAQVDAAALDAETHQILDWYCEGVNAYLAARPKRLAAELNLLRVQPQAWTPVDTLGWQKVVAWGLSGNWEAELARMRLSVTLGAVRAADLEPNYPEKSPVILEGVGSEQAKRLADAAGLLLEHYQSLKQWLGNPGEGMGSNSWVLAPQHSLNRRPLLCNDPHLTVQVPGIWYENHLACPDYEVSGASFAGAPGVVIGHNEEIAWGLTNSCIDLQDLYLERLHPDDSTRVEYCGAWEQAQVLEEVIHVRRRSEPHVERVVITRHGPLISGLLTKENAPVDVSLALRWVGHEPDSSLAAALRLNQATNWQEFDAALAGWGAPALNVTFADVRGNIGYIMAGRAPVRDKNLGLLPAPGWDSEHEWNGFIPHAELPRIYNPPSGKIVTANNKITGDDYPYFLGIEFFPGWRAARIEELLAEKDRFTVRDMEEFQLDTGSKFAEMLTPWITLLNSDDPWEKVSIASLRKWNHRMDSESKDALVFHYVLLELLEMVFADKLGDELPAYLGIADNPLAPFNSLADRAQTRLLELINNHERSTWYTERASGRQRDREQLLQEALTRAIRRIRATLGDSTLKWAWGRSHQVRYGHPLGSARMVGGLFERGPIAIGGDGNSPNQTRHTARHPLGLVQVVATYRQIYEVGAWDRAQSVTNCGQSGHPLSHNYDDQIMMWREGVYHRMPWNREAVEKVAEQKLVIKP